MVGDTIEADDMRMMELGEELGFLSGKRGGGREEGGGKGYVPTPVSPMAMTTVTLATG